MEKGIDWLSIGVSLLPTLRWVGPVVAKVTLEVLNPRGEIIPPPTLAPAPRIPDLVGKKIGIYWNGKQGGSNFWDVIEEQMKEKFPTATILRYKGPFDLGERLAETLAREVDTFLYGVGDWGSCTWASVSGLIRLEKLGKPGIFVVTDNFAHDARSSADDNNMPTIRIVTVPAQEFYKRRISKEGVKPVAVGAMNAMIDAITHPLTQEEAKPKQRKIEKLQANKITAESYELAVEQFNQFYLDHHWGDGLPLVPPTPKSVQWMLTGTSRSPQEVIGKVAPKNGIATIEKIAINAVMAGAKPEYLPVIIAAMEGITDKHFDLLHVATSSGSFNLLIMVNGPIAKEINMNSGIGFLGHGWRANNTIGRAVRLNLINLGYLWPAENDMALIGRPSSHTFFTFAENEESSPWDPYHVSLGYKKENSCVTVSTIGSYEGGMTIYGGGAVAPWDTKSILDKIINDIGSNRKMFALFKSGVANPAVHPRKHIIILHPECAIEIHRLGYTRESLQKYLYERTSVAYEELSPEEVQGLQERIEASVTGGIILADVIRQDRIPVFREALKPGGKVPVVVSPEDIPIIVGGGSPGYTFGISYIKAPYAPTSHQTKLIRGATLTQAGR